MEKMFQNFGFSSSQDMTRFPQMPPFPTASASLISEPHSHKGITKPTFKMMMSRRRDIMSCLPAPTLFQPRLPGHLRVVPREGREGGRIDVAAGAALELSIMSYMGSTTLVQRDIEEESTRCELCDEAAKHIKEKKKLTENLDSKHGHV
ncbi:hypothetical protein TIFTF001_025163 [Ficus carica]|uniref:Uncharacterized protein n=1 Tax=Ficus carica TaxID=3494 RepID=A0AA88AJC7_FICCA|nr:hypothetical protein TIFTF001_025163 [Ficus carica]